MSSNSPNVSACRHCFYYQVEGRRGGNCQQLGVPVQAHWRACPLAAPLFATSLERQSAPAYSTTTLVSALETTPTCANAPELPASAEVIPIHAGIRRLTLRSPSMRA